METKTFELITKTGANSDHLLFSLSYLLIRETDGLEEINLDIPIRSLFNEPFQPDDFILTVIVFELQHGYNIPDDFLDYGLTLREFSKRISRLSQLKADEFEKHLQDMGLVASKAYPIDDETFDINQLEKILFDDRE